MNISPMNSPVSLASERLVSSSAEKHSQSEGTQDSENIAEQTYASKPANNIGNYNSEIKQLNGLDAQYQGFGRSEPETLVITEDKTEVTTAPGQSVIIDDARNVEVELQSNPDIPNQPIVVVGDADSLTVTGTDADERVMVEGDHNEFFLGEGENTGIVSGIRNKIIGGSESDYFISAEGIGSLFGEGGDDTLVIANGTTHVKFGKSIAYGGGGSDTMIVTDTKGASIIGDGAFFEDGQFVKSGPDGSDTFHVSNSDDVVIHAGGEADTAYVDALSTGVSFSGDDGEDLLVIATDFDPDTYVAEMELIGFGDVLGWTGGFFVQGSAGDNWVHVNSVERIEFQNDYALVLNEEGTGYDIDG